MPNLPIKTTRKRTAKLNSHKHRVAGSIQDVTRFQFNCSSIRCHFFGRTDSRYVGAERRQVNGLAAQHSNNKCQWALTECIPPPTIITHGPLSTGSETELPNLAPSVLTADFQVNMGKRNLSWSSSTRSRRESLQIMAEIFKHVWRSSCCTTNSTEGNTNIDPNRNLASFYFHARTPEESSTGSFTPALWCQ